MLYLLGLSYGATSFALEALGVPLSKERVYHAVQSAAQRVPGMKRRALFPGLRTAAMGSDLTTVKCQGKWLTLGITVDALQGVVLSIDALPAEDAQMLKAWLKPIARRLGADLLVTDDADSFKIAAHELGLDQQVCISHVVRNTEAIIEQWRPHVAYDTDGSLATLGVTAEQALADLDRLGHLIHERKPEQEAELETIYQRYQRALCPKKDERWSLAYRLRMLFLDRWNLWRVLTRYRLWEGPQGERLDGTNNATERAIGWWIKERYRSMRGYKRRHCAVRVSRLLAWCGNHVSRGGADLAPLIV
jgi:transposase-like protein